MPVFRELSSASNDTDELIEESGNVHSRDTGGKEIRLYDSGGMKEEIDGKPF